MIALVHGYSLSGSGSNLWTRAVVRALCENGETVHLLAQERTPEQYPFVSTAYTYAPDGTRTTRLERTAETPGACILHRPELDVLPTYVRPSASATGMACILDMEEAAIEDYLARNTAVLKTVIRRHDIQGVHVNHVVLMAQAVARACMSTGVPFGVMPHGSAIEYVVKKSPAMHRLAQTTLQQADRLFILNPEVRRRLRDVFPELRHLEAKMVTAPAGVDTSQFELVPRDERPAAIGRLKDVVRDVPRGRTAEHATTLVDGLHPNLTLEEAHALFDRAADYAQRRPDADLEKGLDRIDWSSAEVLVYVGRLISHKGVPTLAAAFPLIYRERSQARLVLAGAGPLREILEAFFWALRHGHPGLARQFIRWGGALEDEAADTFAPVQAFFDHLEADGALDDYYEAAAALPADAVVFTGYLEHDALSLLFPCCDVGVFPSVVKEASPLVIPEASASGCFPVGTDHSGMAASLDVVASVLPEAVRPLLRLRPDPAHTVRDLVRHAPAALAAAPHYRVALHDLAVDRFDWHSIAAGLADALREMKQD